VKRAGKKEPEPKEQPAGILRAIAKANEVLAAADVREPDDIHVTRIAAQLGARVVYSRIAMADAAAVSAGRKGWILIDEQWRGTYRARWSIAHELGHYLLHEDADAIARIHGGGPLLRSDFRFEREANAFAAQFTMPDFLYAPRCQIERPTLDDVRELGETFGVSLQAAGRRYARVTQSACAFVEIDPSGHVYHPERSTTFRGVAVKDRVVEESTIAGAILRGEAVRGGGRVGSGAWGSGKLRVEMTEHAEVVPESSVVVSLLWHPSSAVR